MVEGELDTITQAHLAAERLEKANKLNEELLRRMEELESRRVLGGKTTAGIPMHQELTPEQKEIVDLKTYFKGTNIAKAIDKVYQ